MMARYSLTVGDLKMRYRKHDDRTTRWLALLFKVLFVTCVAAMTNGLLLLLLSLDLRGAFLWFFGGFYAMCAVVVVFSLLGDR